MDIEDWYHLDYFRGLECNSDYSLLDGISSYCEVLTDFGIQSEFFVVGELANKNKAVLLDLHRLGHRICAHGWGHVRPLEMSMPEFVTEAERSKKILEDTLGASVEGYRAPCFSLDRERLDVIREIGFLYDSSYLPFQAHPLYGTVDLHSFSEPMQGVYRLGDFFAYEISSLCIAGKNVPVAGGGYLRIFPWLLMRSLIKAYLKDHSLYTLYIHPFELSSKMDVPLPKDAGRKARLRFSLGRRTTRKKLSNLISLLRSEGFRFTTFGDLRNEILSQVANGDSTE